MSTEYTTNLNYNDLVKSRWLTIRESEDKQLGPTHKLIYHEGTYAHLIKDEDGNAFLIRYGKNDVLHKILPVIVAEFGCKITDYCGLEYPDCLD